MGGTLIPFWKVRHIWPPRQVALHPGPHGEYSVVRWTTPAADRYSIAAAFAGLAKATTDVHFLHNGRSKFDALLNISGSPNAVTHTSELALGEGDALDFVVGWGNANYGSDSTALTATIKSNAGRTFDLAAEFPCEKNSAGAWSCDWLVPGEQPNATTFRLYTESGRKTRPRFGSLANPGSREWQEVLDDQHPCQRVPHTASLANKGTAPPIRGWLYLKDEWAKRHLIFDGLPSGGLLDNQFYREIIPDTVLVGQDPPTEAVAGAINASRDYSSGLMVAIYKSGAGRFILNTLLIRENLGTDPVAERLLRNLLNSAGNPERKKP